MKHSTRLNSQEENDDSLLNIKMHIQIKPKIDSFQRLLTHQQQPPSLVASRHNHDKGCPVRTHRSPRPEHQRREHSKPEGSKRKEKDGVRSLASSWWLYDDSKNRFQYGAHRVSMEFCGAVVAVCYSYMYTVNSDAMPMLFSFRFQIPRGGREADRREFFPWIPPLKQPGSKCLLLRGQNEVWTICTNKSILATTDAVFSTQAA